MGLSWLELVIHLVTPQQVLLLSVEVVADGTACMETVWSPRLAWVLRLVLLSFRRLVCDLRKGQVVAWEVMAK